MEKLSERDRRLLTEAQKGLELSSSPFAELAERVGLDREEVIERLKRLRKEGFIRRLGGIFNSRKLGWQSLLLAAEVPGDKFYETAELINSHPGVTHNYRRNHRYNMWFTLSVPPEDDLEEEIKKLEEKTGIEFLRLPRLKQYKLGVKLDFESEKGG